MVRYRKLLNISYQRAVSPDSEGFFKRFYEKLNKDPQIAALFSKIDMDRQIKMLIQSMTLVISFAVTMKTSEEMNHIAKIHGKNKLNLPANMYDIWVDCLVDTVKEYDPEFNSQIETAWRVVMAPGIAHMKSFCSNQN